MVGSYNVTIFVCISLILKFILAQKDMLQNFAIVVYSLYYIAYCQFNSVQAISNSRLAKFNGGEKLKTNV